MANMEAVFRDLEKAGKTDVENLIQWMKASKLIETAKDETVRKLFKSHVELGKYKETIAQVAEDQSKTLEQLSKQLAAGGPRIIDAAKVGLQTIKDALKTKKAK